jgi:hypothetical protein
MKMRIILFTLILAVPQSVFCENEKTSESKEEVIYVRSKDEALLYLLSQHKDKKIVLVQERETFLQTISQVGNEIAPRVMPFLVFFLIDSARSLACDKVASYVPNSYKLIDKPYLQINPRDLARISLEGASHIAMSSLLNGSRDENNNFKLHFNRETVADGINMSLSYALMNYLLVPNAREMLKRKYPFVDHKTIPKDFTAARNWAKDQNATREWYVTWARRCLGFTYDQAYQQLKKQYMQR